MIFLFNLVRRSDSYENIYFYRGQEFVDATSQNLCSAGVSRVNKFYQGSLLILFRQLKHMRILFEELKVEIEQQ